MFVCLFVFGAFAMFDCFFVAVYLYVTFFLFIAFLLHLLQVLVLHLFVCYVSLFICSESTVAHTHFHKALLLRFLFCFVVWAV